MKIEQIATDKLIPYARNAKRHDAAQISKIAGSIREFGFNAPVLIDKDNGIIAGHGRVMAAQKLELKTVPCIRLGHLTDTQRRAYILADNRLAEIGGGWDMDMLKLEIGDFMESDISFDNLGFSDNELEEFIRPTSTPDAGAQMSDEAQNEYLNGGVKKFEIYVEIDRYDEVKGMLDSVGAANDLDNNTDILLHCLTKTFQQLPK
jgi:hypothetical protein